MNYKIIKHIKEKTLLHTCVCTDTACKSHVPHVIGIYKILNISPYISTINAVFYLHR